MKPAFLTSVNRALEALPSSVKTATVKKIIYNGLVDLYSKIMIMLFQGKSSMCKKNHGLLRYT